MIYVHHYEITEIYFTFLLIKLGLVAFRFVFNQLTHWLVFVTWAVSANERDALVLLR